MEKLTEPVKARIFNQLANRLGAALPDDCLPKRSELLAVQLAAEADAPHPAVHCIR